MKKIITLTALLGLCLACSNDDDNAEASYTYPASLSLREYKVLGDVKIYTKYGLVTNPQAIASYRANPDGNYFYWDNYSNIPVTYADTVTYQDKDTLLIPRYGDALWSKRVVKKENGYNYFCMKDTMLIYKNSFTSPLQIMAYTIGIFKPYHKDYAYSDIMENYYDADIAKGNAGQLEFPMLTYKLTRSQNGGQYMIAQGNYNNTFDESFLSLLQDGDTLAVQQAKRIYRNINN